MARKPDYRVGALNKRTNAKGRVGGAWLNPNGTISMVLDPFIVLTQEGNNDLLITLFPEGHDVPAS